MTSTAGALFLAREQQTLDSVAVTLESGPAVATAKLFECAAAHDGQPPAAWLAYFRRAWESERAA